MIMTCLLETIEETVDLGGSRDRERYSRCEIMRLSTSTNMPRMARKARIIPARNPCSLGHVGAALGAAQEATRL
jgi:hypothetical protein